ncbi:MAG: hypothetical protein H0X30_09870 [Anaerolineae bacterium]|nr:hypothetical protein [Anaerolineae bacterium]
MSRWLIGIAFDFAVSADSSRPTAATTPPIGGGGHTGAFRCTGGISRDSRHAKMPIQRWSPSQPPAISAGFMHNLQ